MNTSELTGAALDWTVAKCEGFDSETLNIKTGVVYSLRYGHYTPSTDWSQGGPIIERDEICVAKVGRSLDDAMAPHPACWCAHIDGDFAAYGETPLIAAMRCYVASKLGNTVDIPEELQ